MKFEKSVHLVGFIIEKGHTLPLVLFNNQVNVPYNRINITAGPLLKLHFSRSIHMICPG